MSFLCPQRKLKRRLLRRCRNWLIGNNRFYVFRSVELQTAEAPAFGRRFGAYITKVVRPSSAALAAPLKISRHRDLHRQRCSLRDRAEARDAGPIIEVEDILDFGAEGNRLFVDFGVISGAEVKARP